MGKSQKKRLMRRHNPMRVPDSHLPKGLESAAESSAKKEAVLPIMQKMESPDSSERKWACVAASNLIQNDPSTRRLLQGKNVVGSLITRLSDSEEEVWIEAAGALRNLCIDGGYDICAEMYNKNILAPLKAFVPRISSALSQFIDSPKSLPENARRVVYEFAENVITIFWCLSETSNKALNAINAIGFDSFPDLPTATVTAAAQSLYVLTDDNWPAIDAIRSETSDDRFVMLYVLCCGILGNISPLPPPSSAPNFDVSKDLIFPRLHPVISSVSLDAAVQRVQELVARQANEPLEIEKLSLKHVPKSDHKLSTELELEKLENRLRTVQLALEILTGVYATLPDPVAEAELGNDDREELEDGDGDGNMSDAPMEDAMDLDQSSQPVAGDLHTSLSLPSLVRPLLTLIQPTALSFPPPSAPSCHPPTTSALSCLNNIFLSLAAHPHSERCADDSAAQTIWSEIWTSLSKVGVDIAVGQEQKQVIWEIAVGVLWGVGKIWKGKLVPTEEHVRILMSICDASTDSQVQVKCIGALECLAQHPNSLDANRVISSYLLDILPTSTSPSPKGTEPLIQAVSALIDIYSDESLHYDVNFREGKFEDRLAQSVEGLRKAVRAINRKTETDLKLRGEEVRDNLIAFIKYRKELRF
ncbi:ARM repeat-containing protein [Pisolithus orientalis]|uniref:ARM repeat-containing protein n=1 Tax=Pisolithus orientalis TaxID=936130 RepID=UPI002224C8AA|nr:ARM repeat-containing protein [Pisolithus orientalis]KAI6008408.1 ARM repeat-containing protein [Pisolithus orientalis]